jgi:uncharacterized protein (TIRG00374 family)
MEILGYFQGECMKAAMKRNLNIAFILGTLVLILVIGIRNNELTNIGKALTNLSPWWLLACPLGWVGNLAFESLSLQYFLLKQGYRITFMYAVFVSLMGLYYSNITPGASGGQPMQVYYLKKREVPIGVSTSILTVKYFCFQFMLLAMGGIVWLAQPNFVSDQLWGAKVFLVAGYLFNSLTVSLVLFMVINKRIVRFLMGLVVKLLALLHIIKDPIQTMAKWEGILTTFHSSVMIIRKHPRELLVQLVLNGLQILSFMAVTVCVYRALHLTGTPIFKVVTMSLLLYISASYTPLPGASGAQEGGFMIFLKNIFPADKIFPALLLWRFSTFYLSLVAGAGTTVVRTTRGIVKTQEKLPGERKQE